MDYKGSSCKAELHFLMTKYMMIRRLKREVLHELPPKRRQKIEVTVDSRQLQAIQEQIRGIPKSFEELISEF